MTSAREGGSTKKEWVAYGNEKDAAAVGDRRRPEGELMAEGTRKEAVIRRKKDNVSGKSSG